MLKYRQRSKVGRGAQLDVSLFDEAVMTISASTTLFLGASSQALVRTMVQSLEPGGGVVEKSPLSSLLRRGFLIPSARRVAPHLLPKDGGSFPFGWLRYANY